MYPYPSVGWTVFTNVVIFTGTRQLIETKMTTENIFQPYLVATPSNQVPLDLNSEISKHVCAA